MNDVADPIDDIVKISPEIHEVIFENDRIRAQGNGQTRRPGGHA